MSDGLTLDDLKDGVLYSVQQAADVLGMSYNSVRDAINRGDLPAFRPAGIRILGKDIKAFLEKRRIQPREDRMGAPSPKQSQARPLKHIRLKAGG